MPACCSTDPVQRDGLGFQVPRVWQPDGPAFAHILVLSISPFVLAPAAHSKHHCLQVVLPVFPAALLFDGQPQENMVEAPSQDALASGCDRQDVFHLRALRLVLLPSACRRGMCWRAGSWVLPWETLEPASGEKGTRDGTERRGTTQEKKLSQGERVTINGLHAEVQYHFQPWVQPPLSKSSQLPQLSVAGLNAVLSWLQTGTNPNACPKERSRSGPSSCPGRSCRSSHSVPL